jgi:predicted deacylase
MTGSKEARFVSRPSPDGTEHRIPVGIINGSSPGEQVTILAGQHGTEYDGIEAVQRLYRTTDPDQVRGRIVVGLILNLVSFHTWSQFAATPPEVTEMMKSLAEGSQYLINCHGGEFSEGMCPYVICQLVGNDTIDTTAMMMAEAFGVPIIATSQYRGEPPPDLETRPAWWLWPSKSMADELGIPEIIPEVGQRGSRDDEGMMYQGIVNVLRRIGILEGEYVPPPQPPRVIGDRYWLTADAEGTFFPEVEICAEVTPGQRLGTVRDYFGNPLQDVTAPAAARVMNMNVGMPVQQDGFLLWLGDA